METTESTQQLPPYKSTRVDTGMESDIREREQVIDELQAPRSFPTFA